MNENNPHKCPVCEYDTSYKSALNKHIEAVHEGKKPHKCSKCDYSSSYKGDLKKHLEAVHEGKKHNWKLILNHFIKETNSIAQSAI